MLEFNTGGDIEGFVGNELSANDFLPDRVFILSDVRQSAMIGLEWFNQHVFGVEEVRKMPM
jgi:hypothetical protein